MLTDEQRQRLKTLLKRAYHRSFTPADQSELAELRKLRKAEITASQIGCEPTPEEIAVLCAGIRLRWPKHRREQEESRGLVIVDLERDTVTGPSYGGQFSD